MINYDKHEIREQLTQDQVFELISDFGGDPEWAAFGIVSSTICHNAPGEGSRKLYYYNNSKLFQCYTGCGEAFDIFQLVVKVAKIQYNQDYDLNDAVRYVAYKFGIAGSAEVDELVSNKEDWQALENYDRIQEIELKDLSVELKEYDNVILDRFNYNVLIDPWLQENISQESMDLARIGFFPGSNQITIPHFDASGRLVGLRGRTLVQEDAERFGKYRPLRVGNNWFNHPLGMNLYNLNNSKDKIKIMQKAIIFESEKSCLKYQSYFGIDNDITVACCGSNISAYQIQMLIEAGAKEIIVAFDRQFQALGDDEHKHLIRNFKKLHGRYKNDVLLSFIIDKNMITSYKASPIDEGPEKFLKLFKERVVL